ncbi:unnamed protein product, partial [Brenthis ino]
METDEDMVIVIVGDENEGEAFPAPIEIKEEILDEDEMNQIFVNLLKKFESGSEFDISIVKDEQLSDEYDEHRKENEYEYSFLEDAEVNPDDQEYVPENLEDSLDEISFSSSDESKNNKKRKKERHRTQMLKPSERKSYVKDLREQYPELNEDQDLLITCLVEIMKGTKAPAPPQDYFIMNGIMLECVYCGVQSESIPAASRHFQEKHGERYLYCFACGVNFRSTTNLYKHEKRCTAPDIRTVLKARAISLGRKGRSRPFIPKIIDQPPQRYSCSECSASFSSRYTLRAHTLHHRGERPHRCRHCPAAYTSYTALSRHVKKHGDAQFVCEHCRRSFKLKAALATHMDTHRPMKKFGCELCPKRYSQKAALLLHVNKVHKNLPPPCACQLCPKRYPRMSLLKDHMKKIHGMNIMTRKMFFKKLPTMSETQVQQAKVILKREVDDPNYDLANFNV